MIIYAKNLTSKNASHRFYAVLQQKMLQINLQNYAKKCQQTGTGNNAQHKVADVDDSAIAQTRVALQTSAVGSYLKIIFHQKTIIIFILIYTLTNFFHKFGVFIYFFAQKCEIGNLVSDAGDLKKTPRYSRLETDTDETLTRDQDTQK